MASFAPRYARAFADVIGDRKLNAVEVLAQVRSIADTIAANPQLKAVWENPSVEGKQKIKLLDAIAARLGSKREVRNFVAVLIDHHRISSISEILEQLQRELNARMGLADAEIVSTRELDSKEKRELESQVEAATGKKIQATYRQDRNLLGGVIVKVGSTIYDGSVRGQLQRLKEQLSAS